MPAATRHAVNVVPLVLLALTAACSDRGGGDPAPAPVPWASATTPAPAAACQHAARAPAFHRLNRHEYQNTVNQLLGTRLALAEQLATDSLVNGFDNNGDTAVSAPLVQRYLNLAESAVAEALSDPAARARLLPCPITSPGCLRQAVAAFLPRAFRRPVAPAEVDEILGHAQVCDQGPLSGLACALEAALVDPSFLFRTELHGAAASSSVCAPEATVTSRAGPDAALAPHGLAARLSYFLWSSGPDQRLMDLAAAGQLDDPAVIEAEVNRMLAPQAQAAFSRPFSESLPVQWLGLDSLGSAAPAPALYPRFDEELRAAMAGESRHFFAELLHQNRSALELLRAPFTFANERLAAHYGLPGVRGPELRRVDTAGTARGGILTQASLLTVTSSSERTSIALRARWVMQNLLCTPLGDPPPGAEEMVPAPDPALGLTARQSLEQRTSMPPCSACHAAMNPLGYGLEIFDAVGAQRSHDRGQPIDPSGVLPGGQAFRDTDQMLSLLQQDPRFPACLTEKMLVYALGRGLTTDCDREALRTLVADFAADGYRLKNHVVRIARSELFRSARLREATPE